VDDAARVTEGERAAHRQEDRARLAGRQAAARLQPGLEVEPVQELGDQVGTPVAQLAALDESNHVAVLDAAQGLDLAQEAAHPVGGGHVDVQHLERQPVPVSLHLVDRAEAAAADGAHQPIAGKGTGSSGSRSAAGTRSFSVGWSSMAIIARGHRQDRCARPSH
jgi:hypothetical protein